MARKESSLGRGLDREGRGDYGHGYGWFQLDDQRRPGATPRDPKLLASVQHDPVHAAEVAASMLAGLLKQYGGDIRKALSAYNTGGVTATGLAYADAVLRGA